MTPSAAESAAESELVIDNPTIERQIAEYLVLVGKRQRGEDGPADQARTRQLIVVLNDFSRPLAVGMYRIGAFTMELKDGQAGGQLRTLRADNKDALRLGEGP